MLYSADSGKIVTRLPHKTDFDRWMKNLSDDDYRKITEELKKKIGNSDINTAGWIPGNDWTGTVYEPIYYACGKNKVQSGMFFGLIVFELLMSIKDRTWGFGKYDLNGKPIKSMTYFIIDNPSHTAPILR